MVWTCAHTLCNNDGPSLGWIMGGGVSIYIYICAYMCPKKKKKYIYIYSGCGPLPATVTRSTTFLVENPYEPLFTTVTGRGPRPNYIYIYYMDPGGFCCWERENPDKYSENLRLKFTNKRKENCKTSSRFTKYAKPKNHPQLIQITRSPCDHSKS